ncbi:MAG: hypothetical protein WA816_11035 [Bacteroidales bacterium]
MKRIFIIATLLTAVVSLAGQTNKADKLQVPEQNQPASQDITATARLKSASRLFGTKDDLTSVIFIIPADSVVTVLDSDSTYYHVVFEENEGFIFKRDAVIVEPPVNTQPSIQSQPSVQNAEPVQEQQESRYSYLENKYGSNMASRLFSGKIWKGMTSEMVKDSWGTADKINRIISSNVVKEEWIFRSTWLYFENNTLLEWGPVKK